MALVVLNQLLLPRVAEEVAMILTNTNQDALDALGNMRKETLQTTAGDLLLLASQAKEMLKVDLTEASGRAAAIVAGIESGLRISRAVWIAVGAIGCAVFGLGLIVGAALER
ncbi:MAG: hypothetical protein JWN34_3208 [Bryobacterales bacterium]|nr:hypothetical protein [Bryobacterales bacterium]